MINETLPSSAPEALRRQSEKIALEKVASREGRIHEVQFEQKKSINQLIGAKGGDGASADVGMSEVHSEQLKEVQDLVEADAAERESRFDNNVMVSNNIGEAAGQERDSDHSVRVAESIASIKTPRAQAVEVDSHEHRHTQQKPANESSTPLTGDAQADNLLQVNHLAYREEDAMHVAGDAFTAKEYTRDYKKPVNRVAAYLNAGGENGDALVRNSGLNGEIAEVRNAIRRVQQNKSSSPEGVQVV